MRAIPVARGKQTFNTYVMKNLFAIAPFVVLVACEAASPVPAAPPQPLVPSASQDTCGASQNANLIGQDATALERILIIGQVRVIRPGQPVTQDFRPERINFNVGADNRITSIWCS